jgi:hypothetical protein
MASAAEYRVFAKDCFRWAEKTDDPEQRTSFLEMAKTWTQAAVALELRNIAKGREPEATEN